jgi:two-component system chemotaxis response regulator CheY
LPVSAIVATIAMSMKVERIHYLKNQMNSTNTVLIVDDSRVSRMMSKQYVLNKCPDWAIEEAGSGEEALEKVRTFMPTLILLDVNMPGMGGLAAAEQLRKQCPGAHISLVTANVQHATRNRANQMGIGFIEKPLNEARIHQLIDAIQA